MTISDQRSLQTEYIYALPKSLMGAAVAPPPIPAPVRMNGQVVGVYDGDSIYVRTEFGVYGIEVEKQLYRVIGIACRELGEPGGKEARDALRARSGMAPGSPVVLTAITNDKYGGRLDAVVSYRSADGSVRDLAADLIADGWAVPWNGSGTQPKPAWPRSAPSAP